MKGLSIFVASGVTSSLFASLLPMISHHKLYAPIRAESDPVKIQAIKDAGVEFAPQEEYDHRIFDRVLWFSSHSCSEEELKRLERYAKEMPTMAVNSVAILGILRGKQDEVTANAYQKDKLSLSRVPKLYNLFSGFFIQDVKDPEWANKGLHGDTTAIVFADKLYEGKDFDWEKKFYVTPKSLFCSNCICKWIDKPNDFDTKNVFCSTISYSRKQLREFGQVGSFYMHDVWHESIVDACQMAYHLHGKK